METLIFANSKGGVSKTHLAYHCAKNLSEQGKKVLCLDLDEQAQLTLLLQVPEKITLYDSITRDLPIEDTLGKVSNTLYGVYSDINLRKLEGHLMGSKIGYERVIYRKLRPVLDLFEYIIIDMPPATNMTSMNSYTFPNARVIVPVLLNFLALDSMGQILRTIEEMREFYNPGLRLGGIVVCRDNIEISKHSHDCARILKEKYARELCPVSFRHSIHYANAALSGESIREYLLRSRVGDKHFLEDSINDILKFIYKS